MSEEHVMHAKGAVDRARKGSEVAPDDHDRWLDAHSGPRRVPHALPYRSGVRSPLPPPLVASPAGSFAHLAVTERLPSIARRVIAENDFAPAIVAGLTALAGDAAQGTLHWFGDDGGPDVAAWARYAQPFLGQRWTEVPCCFAETYFYRALLAITRYFGAGLGRAVDPYAQQKRLAVVTAMDAIQALSARCNAAGAWGWDRHSFIQLLHTALWGNRADLCLWPVTGGTSAWSQEPHPDVRDHLLVDDSSAVADRVATLHATRIDFILDNAGFELVCDLCLVDGLLTSGRAGTVWLHVKAHPTFVSDATVTDVHGTLQLLAGQPHAEVQALAQRVQHYLAEGRLRLRDDFFWTSPLVFWEMPERLVQQLAHAQLIVVKGDMNYRRLLGDRLWPLSTPFAEIVSYFPAPVTALRTLKAELAAGLSAQQIARADHRDPHWLTNGQWGVIQFTDPLPVHDRSRSIVPQTELALRDSLVRQPGLLA